MAIDGAQAERIAGKLWEAEQRATPLERPVSASVQLTEADAYAIRAAGQRLRQQGRENPVVGYKVAFSGKATQQAYGVTEPIWTTILASNLVTEGDPVAMSELVDPRIEPEICFLLREDLAGPAATVAHVLAATAGVLPAFEVADCRIAGWKITGLDGVADNGLHARLVVGERMLPPLELDLRSIGMTLMRNQRVVGIGASAAALGNPARVMAWLANKLAQHGERLRAGQLVITGSLVVPEVVEAGDVVTATFDRLGPITQQFV